MADAFIGRQSWIWLGIEATRWTAVAPKVWLSKTAWVLNPTTETATDDSWYGVIDEVAWSFTTKNFSNISLEWIVKDDSIWYLLHLALWKYDKLKVFTWTVAWWTPARWDTVSGGVLRKIITIGWTKYYFFDGNVSWASISNGTWTLTATEVNSFQAHLFTRLNSNAHPSATIYDNDPVASSYAPFMMINNFELSCEVADYVRFTTELQWKQMQAVEWALTPAYSDEPEFTASMCGVRFADDESWLDSASEICMQNFRIAINKNLTDVQCFGSTDIEALYNQQFGVEWDFEAIFDNTVLRDYALNSTKKAIRFYVENNWTSFSAMYVDVMKAWLNDWSKTDGNNELIRQTMWFTGEYSTNDWATIEVLLINSNSTWYDA